MAILSICIPTYNRAEILEKALRHLTNLPIFLGSSDIEIVISDNASTDETPQICAKFTSKFPTRIHYHRNSHNIEDANFGRVLSFGNGDFLKLSNDTLLHTNEGLKRTLDAIRKYQKEKPILCIRSHNVPNAEKHFSNLDEFWHERSYFSTWIAEFGTWKEDFTTAEDFARASETHLTQVDFLLRLMSRKQNAIIFDGIFFTLIPRKTIGVGGVNAARVFGTDYFDLLYPYFKSGAIRPSTYNREKWRILRYTILSNYLITRPGFKFPKTGFTKHLFKHYKWKLYFWCSIPFVGLARIISPIRNILGI